MAIYFFFFLSAAFVDFIGPENVELATNETLQFEVEATSTLGNANLTFDLLENRRKL